MTNTENIEEMVRDFCSVAPKSKSEVRQRISESIAQAIAEDRVRVMGEIEIMYEKKWIIHERGCIENRRPCGAVEKPGKLADRCYIKSYDKETLDDLLSSLT